jgi:rhodanese-related sulfurtransferase
MDTPAASTSFERLPRRAQTCMVPKPQQLDPGLVVVDATWGTIQPIAVTPGVETVGELELIEHLHAGRQLIDTRQSRFVEQGTIPGAVAIPHTEIAERLGELDPYQPIVLFCNGPQCSATPDAVRRLLAAGRTPALMLYYRGGMHDWITLGLPIDARSRSV